MGKNIPQVHGVTLSAIRNRNEKRVAEAMNQILDAEYADYILDPLDIEDIYALALNILPALYAQSGSIILQKVPSSDDVHDAIREATDRVLKNPTRASKQ